MKPVNNIISMPFEKELKEFQNSYINATTYKAHHIIRLSTKMIVNGIRNMVVMNLTVPVK